MNQIANDIYSQLGGGRFAAMTGAKGFMWDNEKQLLRILLSKNGSKANRLDVIYNSDDTYTMHFYRYTQEKIKIDYEKQEVRTIPEKITEVKTYSHVYCDQLQELFTETTKMYLTL